MSKNSGRLTLVVPPDMEDALSRMKRERYPDSSSAEMIRDLLAAGLRSGKAGQHNQPAAEERPAYQSPSAHRIAHIGPMDNGQIAALSDEELETYMQENGYQAAKKRYRANSNYVLREVAGEHLLIPTGNLAGNVMITMNKPCAFLWKLLQEPRTVADLVFEAEKVYDDPSGEMEAQIQEFIIERVQTGHIWEVE